MDYHIEKITWIDSYGCQSSWTEFDQIDVTPVHAISVGYVIKEDDEYVVVLPHFIGETAVNEQQGCGDMAIPKCSIKERKVLK